VFLLFYTGALAAQTSSTPPLIQYPVKGYVVLNNNNRLMIRGLSYADSSHVLLYHPGTNQINGGYTFKDDIRTMTTQTVPIINLKLLKAERQSFLKGATTGGLLGFGIGALLGFITYTDADDLTDKENKDKRSTRAFLGGVVAGVPAGVVGGMAGGLFIKKRFAINGQKDKLTKTLDKLYP
jgi:hypothetical protein